VFLFSAHGEEWRVTSGECRGGRPPGLTRFD
jgi:hypothetical protein